ncbi:MAG: Helix-turn-helix domain of resolvase, partial [Solirubrobacteraceae bacterium]|nr:Helix-turn-helix domain of resolvase [Solirubrobacteraceae bacterium]
AGCGEMFRAQNTDQRFCSRTCSSTQLGLLSRRVERPALPVLLRMITEVGYEAAGRRHGVSGNAIRKWVRSYGVDPPPGGGRDRNPPPRPSPALTDAQASRALDLLAAGTSMYAVAKLLGVSRKTIRDVRRGITYRHLERPAALRLTA